MTTLNPDSNPHAWGAVRELSVVVPVFNAEHHIGALLRRLNTALSGLDRYEIVLVDDCSPDNTIDALRNLADRGDHVHLVPLRRNVGQATATAIGLATAQYEYVVTVDDDLQHDPAEIPLLVSTLAESSLDFVVASIPEYQQTWFRRLASRVVHRIARSSLNTPAKFEFSSFVAYRKSFLQDVRILEYPELELGWLFLLSSRYANVPVSHSPGIRGASTYQLRGLIKAARPFIRHLLTRSIKPLVAVGLATALAAIVLVVGYLVRFIVAGTQIPGFATLAILGLTNIAITSLFLAVALQWLARIRLLHLSRLASAVSSQNPLSNT